MSAVTAVHDALCDVCFNIWQRASPFARGIVSDRFARQSESKRASASYFWTAELNPRRNSCKQRASLVFFSPFLSLLLFISWPLQHILFFQTYFTKLTLSLYLFKMSFSFSLYNYVTWNGSKGCPVFQCRWKGILKEAEKCFTHSRSSLICGLLLIYSP